MFHAAGWTYPWAITAAFAAQVSRNAGVRDCHLTPLADHAPNRQYLPNLVSLPEFRRKPLLRCAYRTGETSPSQRPRTRKLSKL
jgi:hypothetical protein